MKTGQEISNYWLHRGENNESGRSCPQNKWGNIVRDSIEMDTDWKQIEIKIKKSCIREHKIRKRDIKLLTA